MRRRLLSKLAILALLLMAAAFPPSARASSNPCSGNSTACRQAGFSGCCNNSCSCSDTDPTVCDCICC